MVALELHYNNTARLGEPFSLLKESFEKLKKEKSRLKEKLKGEGR